MTHPKRRPHPILEKLENDSSKLGRLEHDHPSLERLENDSSKNQTSSKRDLKMTYPILEKLENDSSKR
jgi:hypothetical protein